MRCTWLDYRDNRTERNASVDKTAALTQNLECRRNGKRLTGSSTAATGINN
jgi:hypothetical protein